MLASVSKYRTVFSPWGYNANYKAEREEPLKFANGVDVDLSQDANIGLFGSPRVSL